jgi:hypothetical protein
MYERPSRFASLAISSIVFLPSDDHVECECRSPRMSVSSTSGEATFAGGLELAHVLAQLGRDPRVAEALVHGLFGLVREDLAGLGVWMPYSEIELAAHGSSRSATLCCFEPV